MPLPESLIEHLPRGLGKPVVDGGEDHEEDSADQDVMEMCDHEIGIGELPAERRDRQHYSGQASDKKLKQKCYGEEHRDPQPDAPAPHGAKPVEDLDASGNAHEH